MNKYKIIYDIPARSYQLYKAGSSSNVPNFQIFINSYKTFIEAREVYFELVANGGNETIELDPHTTQQVKK